MGLKYIMFEYKGRRFPFVFPDNFVHSEMNEVIQWAARKHHFDEEPFKAISAGAIDVHECTTHGSSETLHLKSDKADDKILTVHNYCHGRNFPGGGVIEPPVMKGGSGKGTLAKRLKGRP